MERKKRSRGSVWEFCYANKIFGTFGLEMRACGQKFVKFCTLTHAAKLVVTKDESPMCLAMYEWLRIRRLPNSIVSSVRSDLHAGGYSSSSCVTSVSAVGGHHALRHAFLSWDLTGEVGVADNIRSCPPMQATSKCPNYQRQIKQEMCRPIKNSLTRSFCFPQLVPLPHYVSLSVATDCNR